MNYFYLSVMHEWILKTKGHLINIMYAQGKQINFACCVCLALLQDSSCQVVTFFLFSGLICVFFCFSEKYTRFCQWKNLELNINVSVYLAVCVAQDRKERERIMCMCVSLSFLLTLCVCLCVCCCMCV